MRSLTLRRSPRPNTQQHIADRRQPRPIRALVAFAAAAALPVAGVAAAVPARAATPLCDNSTTRYCISAMSFSPSTVANTKDTPVTVTVTANPGHRCLYVYGRVDQLGTTAGNMLMQFNEVWWRPGTYTGTFTVLAGAKPGQLPFDSMVDCGGAGSFTGDKIAASTLTKLSVTGTQDLTGPSVTGVTLAQTSADVTAGAVQVPITIHAKDVASGVDRIQATFRPNGQTGYSRARATLSTLTRGTLQDGDFTGSVTFPQGAKATWGLELLTIDRFGNQRAYSPADLAAAGLPNAVTTITRP